MAKLLRCDTLWGSCAWSDAAPGLRHAAQAIYRPTGGTGPWGVFADGEPLGACGGLGDTDLKDIATDAVEEGPFLYIGPVSTHYGHLIVNTLAHLWPLLSWSGRRPRLLTLPPPGPPETWEAAWAGLDLLVASLAALGCTIHDLAVFDRPVRLTDVHVPEPALCEQAGIHAVYGALCRRIGCAHWREGEADRLSQPLYLSKTRLRRGIARVVNEAEIVEALEARGVVVAHPETLPFPEQVALISRHRVVMGSVGSAFHTAAFAAPGRRIVGLNWQSRLNANFALIDRATGMRGRYYHPHGTTYEETPDWHIGWRVADPKGVAGALLKRAEWLDRGERDDEGLLADLRRRTVRLSRGMLRR